MEYKVIKQYDKEYFEELVAEAIKEGWKPLGGVCFGDGDFIQAMIRE